MTIDEIKMHDDIQINNQIVLGALNDFKDFIFERYKSGELEKDLSVNCKDHTRDRWLADDYMHRIIDRNRAHEGFPESMHSFHGMMPSGETNQMHAPGGLKKLMEYREKAGETNQTLMTELSAKRNTLITVYPPGGWISWHNNANASGYNVIFSWSETGDGWFDYWDIEKKERVRIPDKAGWQCKMTYFGSYDEPERLCYHAASTNCLRMSVAYVFSSAEDIWKDVIEDIANPL
jgi:hypothetical protein